MFLTQVPPYSDIECTNAYCILKDSIHTRIIDILAQKYNFSYTVIDSNHIWGTFENGVWKGCVGHLYNKVFQIHTW